MTPNNAVSRFMAREIHPLSFVAETRIKRTPEIRRHANRLLAVIELRPLMEAPKPRIVAPAVCPAAGSRSLGYHAAGSARCGPDRPAEARSPAAQGDHSGAQKDPSRAVQTQPARSWRLQSDRHSGGDVMLPTVTAFDILHRCYMLSVSMSGMLWILRIQHRILAQEGK